MFPKGGSFAKSLAKEGSFAKGKDESLAKEGSFAKRHAEGRGQGDPEKKKDSSSVLCPADSPGSESSGSASRGKDVKPRSKRGTVGTFAGRVPPKNLNKQAIFNMMKDEYANSKKWAKEEGLRIHTIDGEALDQVFYKMAKRILDDEKKGTMDERMNYVTEMWRTFLKSKFTCERVP